MRVKTGTDMNIFATKLTGQGYYCIESKFRSVLYAAKDKDLIILSKKDGIAINIENIPEFCEELMGVYEILEYKKAIGHKG